MCPTKRLVMISITLAANERSRQAWQMAGCAGRFLLHDLARLPGDGERGGVFSRASAASSTRRSASCGSSCKLERGRKEPG